MQIIVRDKPGLYFKADEAASVLSNQPEINSGCAGLAVE